MTTETNLVGGNEGGAFSPAFKAVRESVGDAIHTAIHPGHPWSGCNNPDGVYLQLNRLADYLIDTPGAAPAWIRFGREYWRSRARPAIEGSVRL